jgi:hypothetical protein
MTTNRLIFLLLVIATTIRAAEPQLTSVCDILKDPVQWDGRMIEVRAPVMGVQDYMVMAPECAVTVEVKGTKFPMGFSLVSPNIKSVIIHQVDFPYDQAAWIELGRWDREAGRRKEQVWATVVGLFETKVPLDELVKLVNEKKPRLVDRGFGHMGGAPGQIVVKTLRDFRIERNPSQAAFASAEYFTRLPCDAEQRENYLAKRCDLGRGDRLPMTR